MLVLSVLSHTALAETILDRRTLYEECGWNSQEVMQNCLLEKARETERALKKVEAATLTHIDQWDEYARYIGESKRRLLASHKAFAAYRTAHCAYLSSLSGGGAGGSREMGRLMCVAELNSRRAAQLRDEVSGLHLKDRQ
jgi:uncharacterized protein YecT (DUF1311 family)